MIHHKKEPKQGETSNFEQPLLFLVVAQLLRACPFIMSNRTCQERSFQQKQMIKQKRKKKKKNTLCQQQEESLKSLLYDAL